MSFKNGLKAFFKVGAIGFGGGTALIPVIEREVVQKYQLVSKEDFASDMVIQGITPGAFPIKSATSLGIALGSGGKAVALAYTTSAVGAILALIFSVILSVLSPATLTWVEYIGVGISAFVIVIIGKFVIKVPHDALKRKTLLFCLILMAFAVLLSCGEKIEKILAQFIGRPISLNIPQLSTVTILLLGLNYVFITKLATRFTPLVIARYIFATIITILAVLSMATSPIIDINWLKYTVYAVIAASITIALTIDFLSVRAKLKLAPDSARGKINIHKVVLIPLSAIGIALVPCIIIGVGAAVTTSMPLTQFFRYIGSSMLSVITTFGGGTAYISVSEGMFVANGALPAEVFWSQIVPMSNSLPGPLLVKMLAGIWYNLSSIAGGGIAANILMSLFGIVLGITTTIVSFLSVYILYSCLSNLSIFSQIKMAILPLIAGLLIPTILSMVSNMLSISMTCSINVWHSALITLLLIGLCTLLSVRFKVKDYYLLLIFGSSSTLILGLLSALL